MQLGQLENVNKSDSGAKIIKGVIFRVVNDKPETKNSKCILVRDFLLTITSVAVRRPF